MHERNAARGLFDLCLGRFAVAADTSPRMLIFHFTTRDRLVTAAFHEAHQRQRELFDRVLQPRPGIAYAEVLREAWAAITAPDAGPYLRLWPKFHDARTDSTPWPEFRTLSITDWLPAMHAGLTADGRRDAQPLAIALVATVGGLFSDLGTTGDLNRTTAAWHAFIYVLDTNPTAPR